VFGWLWRGLLQAIQTVIVDDTVLLSHIWMTTRFVELAQTWHTTVLIVADARSGKFLMERDTRNALLFTPSKPR